MKRTLFALMTILCFIGTGAIGCVDVDVVAALVEAASGSEYDSVRWRAALSLLAVGEERRLALETLVGCFGRGDSGYREHAAREIKRIAPLVAEWLPAFQAIADDPGEYGYIRSHAEGIIREIENPRWGCSLSIDGWTFELSPKHPSIPESDPGE